MNEENTNNQATKQKLLGEVRSRKLLGQKDNQILSELLPSYAQNDIQSALNALQYMQVSVIAEEDKAAHNSQPEAVAYKSVGYVQTPLQNPEGESESVAPVLKAKVSWKKIALVGAFMMTPISIGIYFLGSVSRSWDIFGLTVTGILPLGLTLALLMVGVFGVYLAKKLQTGIAHPVAVVMAALILTIPVCMVVGVMLPLWLPWAFWAIGLMWVLGGALGLCLSVFLLERINRRVGIFLVAALFFGPIILSSALEYWTNYQDEKNHKTVPVKTLDEKVLPSPLPTGMTDDSDGQGDLRSCEEVYATLDYTEDKAQPVTRYECHYRFDYPGYLSDETQALLKEQFRDSPNPSPHIRVVVTKHDKLLSNGFSYKPNGTCNMFDSKHHLTKEFMKDAILEFNACGKKITPAGNTLYYDASQSTNKVYEPVPNEFYFEQKGNAVFIWVGANTPIKDTNGALFYTDPGFQPTVYEFVDSYN